MGIYRPKRKKKNVNFPGRFRSGRVGLLKIRRALKWGWSRNLLPKKNPWVSSLSVLFLFPVATELRLCKSFSLHFSRENEWLEESSSSNWWKIPRLWHLLRLQRTHCSYPTSLFLSLQFLLSFHNPNLLHIRDLCIVFDYCSQFCRKLALAFFAEN